MDTDGILGPMPGRAGAARCAIFMKFLYPAPLSSLESICGIRDILKSFNYFQAKQDRFAGNLRRKGPPMLSFAFDFIFVAIGAAAFAVTAFYLNACAHM